ncbi:MAG TPA: hypothetical protein PK566_17080 [Pseudobacteroides sp.]|nr:hypothetical protein [Pseudobacteroides sp.]
MLIPINIENKMTISETEISTSTFKDLKLKEEHIEEFLRKNIEVIFGEEESLLIVGQQVNNKEKGRSDLTAIDENGSIVLIEIKRDVDDIKNRREAFEFQAIRYAASYAKIKSPDALVNKIFSKYIEKHKEEFDLGDLTPTEKGKRIINDFLISNNSLKTFNQKQRIILISSSFDTQTLSAVAWLISNNVDISCFSIMPLKIDNQIFLQVDRILPPSSIEDFYVDIEDKKEVEMVKNSTEIVRTNLPRIPKLFEWGLLKKGDMLYIRNHDEEVSQAEVIDERFVSYKGNKITYNQWGQDVTGWSSICIYEWAVKLDCDKTLDSLRREKLAEVDSEE